MTKIASSLSQPFWNINKKPVWEGKCCLLYSNIFFRSRDTEVLKICKLAQWWHHTLNQILIKCDGKRHLSQFISEMFDSLLYDSTKCGPQYECNNLVPHLPNIKGISGHLWCSILIFANGALSAWSRKLIKMLVPFNVLQAENH